MPYNTISELPPAVRNLPAKKQRQFLAVFNGAYSKAKEDGKSNDEAESTAFAQAWAAVKKLSAPEETDVNENMLELAMTPFRFTLPIVKIDKATRTIYGLATAEAIDVTGEVLAYEGSKAAFSGWVGNLREMHQPKAVGKGIEVDPNDDEKSIYVKAKISKGAQDTWEKVLDGTLSFFSVGGNRVQTKMVKASDVPEEVFRTMGEEPRPEKVRWTSKWKMLELSVVDAGALPIAKFDLVKTVDGTPTMTEIIDSGTPAVGAAEIVKSMSDLQEKIEAGGSEAEVAKRAMVKVRAAAKRMQVESVNLDPLLFGCMNKITKLSLADGSEYTFPEPPDPKEFAVLVGVSKAYSVTYVPDTFEVAYERWLEYQDMAFPYNTVSLLDQVLCNILCDPEMDLKEKKKLVVQSMGQFVTIYFDAAKSAHKSADPGVSKTGVSQGEPAMAELEVKKEETVPVVPAALAVPVAPAFDAAAMQKMFSEGFAAQAETVKVAMTSAVEPIKAQIEKVAEGLTVLEKRLETVEAQPVRKAGAVLKVVGKDGKAEEITESGDGPSVVENGVEYDLVSVKARLEKIKGEIEAMPFGISKEREALEIEFCKLNRVNKILSGDQVWDLRRR